MKNCMIMFVDNFLSKAIIFNLYLFALGLFTSKALTSISGGLACLIGLVQMLVLKINPLKIIHPNILIAPILFFTFALIISAIGHPSAESFSEVQKHLFLFLFFLITVSNLTDSKRLKKVLFISAVSMLIAVIYGFYQHYALKMPRIESFSFPLAFGCLVAIFIIFMLIYGFWGKLAAGYRGLFLTGAVLLGVNLLFTHARGAWWGLLGGAFSLAWLKNKKILLILVIFCLALYYLLPQLYIDRFISSFDLEDDSSNLVRIALWKSSLSMYRDHLINGVGLTRFSEEYETNYQQPDPISTTCHAHNNILQFMAEAGTLGLIGFVWLMAAIIVWLYKNYTQTTDPNWRLFHLASLSGIIIFNIQGLTEVNYGDAETIRFFWFLIALNAAIVRLRKNENNQPEQQLSQG